MKYLLYPARASALQMACMRCLRKLVANDSRIFQTTFTRKKTDFGMEPDASDETKLEIAPDSAMPDPLKAYHKQLQKKVRCYFACFAANCAAFL